MNKSWAVAGLVFAAVAAIALIAAYWLAVVYDRPGMAYAVTLACLGFAIVYLVAGRQATEDQRMAQLDGMIKRAGDLLRQLETQRAGPPALRAEPQAAALAPPPPLREESRHQPPPLREPRRQEPRLAAAPRHAEPAREDATLSLGDRLDLYLEPIVDLGSRQTLHYRASMSLKPASGERLAHDALYAEADRGGLRPALDHFAVSRCARLLPRLKRNRPELRLFVPLGRSTLSDQATLQAIERELDPKSNLARSFVFEISFDALGSLDQAGVSGLARIARIAGGLALGGVWNSELDLAALRASRFQFLSFDMTALTEEPSVPPAWTPLAVEATREGFDIIASHADSDAEAEEAHRHARLARGAAFAPPRLVRPEMVDAGRAAAA